MVVWSFLSVQPVCVPRGVNKAVSKMAEDDLAERTKISIPGDVPPHVARGLVSAMRAFESRVAGRRLRRVGRGRSEGYRGSPGHLFRLARRQSSSLPPGRVLTAHAPLANTHERRFGLAVRG
eukprot:1093795_1